VKKVKRLLSNCVHKLIIRFDFSYLYSIYQSKYTIMINRKNKRNEQNVFQLEGAINGTDSTHFDL
jgi:hypothetical protein